MLIGAGTLCGSPATPWTPDHAHPPAAEHYAELRRRRGAPPQPALAVLSGSGKIDSKHPAFEQRAIVLTSRQGAKNLVDMFTASVDIVPVGDGPHLMLLMSGSVPLLIRR